MRTYGPDWILNARSAPQYEMIDGKLVMTEYGKRMVDMDFDLDGIEIPEHKKKALDRDDAVPTSDVIKEAIDKA